MQPNHDRITSDVIYQEPALWVWAGRGKEEVLYEPASLLCKQVLQYTFLDTICQFLDIGGLQHDDCCVTMIIIDRSQEGVKGGKCPGSSLAMHPSGPYLGWLCSICLPVPVQREAALVEVPSKSLLVPGTVDKIVEITENLKETCSS